MHFDLKIGLSWLSKSMRALAVEEVDAAAEETAPAGGAGLAKPPHSTSNNPVAIKIRTTRMGKYYAPPPNRETVMVRSERLQ
jgi:hypothetical protein